MSIRRLFAAALCAALIFSACCAAAESVVLRGYDAKSKERYQYVTFGVYPHEEDGTLAPVLWRVLGPGTPGEDDVINASNVFDPNRHKYCNGDDFTEDLQDAFCLMTEYIVDIALYHTERDVDGGTPLDYQDSLIRSYVSTDMLNRMFTAEEQAALIDMPERGLLSLPTRKGELFRPDYGFVTEDFVESPRRMSLGTPYAYAQGLKHVVTHSWYWTTDWRAPGRRWIVADNGHISVSGLDRLGGIKLVCYIHTDKLLCLGGDGTMDNPFQLSIKPTDGVEALPSPVPAVDTPPEPASCCGSSCSCCSSCTCGCKSKAENTP